MSGLLQSAQNFIANYPADQDLPDDPGIALVGHIEETGVMLDSIRASLPDYYFGEFLDALAADIEQRRAEISE